MQTVVTAPGGSGANQDHAIVTDHAMAVLDGATSSSSSVGQDGGWYARALGAALTARLDDDTLTLPDAVAAAIAEVRDRYGRYGPLDAECPTSTVAIARWTPQRVQLYVLGDSPAVGFGTDGTVHELTDRRLGAVGGPQHDAYRAHLAAGHGYDRRLTELLADLRRAQRRRRNRDGGYWIAGADPDAAHHGLIADHPRAVLDAVLLATDGVSRAVHDYALHTWPSLLRVLADGSPRRVLDAIHDAERQDPDGVRWPRAKRHDDKTLALWTRPSRA